jgi:hypothetical protein
MITRMMMTRFVAQAIGAAAELGFADLLATGSRTIEEIAAATGTLPTTVHRLLRALAASGVFVEEDPGRFANTPLSDALRAGVPGSARDAALFFTHESHVRAWLGLPHSVRTGRSGFAHVHGRPIWDHVHEEPDFADAFHGAMTSLTSWTAGAVADAYDFSGLGTLVDVGGGHGELLLAVLAKNAGLRGVLFDAPHALAGARERVAASGLASRCEVVGGDFFERVPPGDAFLLKHVIHDWSDDDALRILRTVARAARPGQKVLLVELLLKPGNPLDMAALADLEMLVMTDGGCERSLPEYRSLLERAGLSLVRSIRTAAEVHVLEAVHAGP